MKLLVYLLLAGLLLTGFAGCRSNVPQETNGSIVPTASSEMTMPSLPTETTQPADDGETAGTANTESAKILQKIWDSYEEDQRFSAYGGQVEMAVNDGPGDLDMKDTEELTARYLLPQEQLAMVKEGASLVHLMNNNIFTAVVYRLTDGSQMKTLADAWQKAIRDNQWICGQPDRLLLVQVDDSHILMCFGSQDLIPDFEAKLQSAYPNSKVLHKEAIIA